MNRERLIMRCTRAAALSAMIGLAAAAAGQVDRPSAAATDRVDLAPGPDDPRAADSLRNQARALRDTGDYVGARSLYERALAIQEKALGPDHPDVAASLSDLGTVLYSTGDYAGARRLYERAIGIQEKALGSQPPRLANSLNNLASLLDDVGDYAGARPLYERALAIIEKALGPDHPSVAVILSNLGNLLRATGDYVGARPLYERALAIKERALGPDHRSVANTLGNLAVLLDDLGDDTGARPLLERALAIQEKALGPDHPDVANSLDNLGIVLKHAGDLAGTRSVFERALAIREKALGPDHPDVATSLDALAELLRATGDYAGARPLLERALAIQEKAFGPDHPEVANSLSYLGNLLRATGDDAAARPLRERVLAIEEKVRSPGDPVVAEALLDVADVDLALGRSAEALEAALRAEQVGREHVRLTARALSEGQALRYAAVRPSGLDVALSVLDRDSAGDVRRRVFDSVIRSRAIVLDELASRHHALSVARDTALDRLADRLRAVSARYANLVVRGPGEQGAEAYAALVDSARREHEQAERALGEKSLGFRAQQARGQFGLTEVAAALPRGSALVSLVRYNRQTARSDTIPSYLALVLRGRDTADPVVVPLGAAREIDLLVHEWSTEAGRGVELGSRIPPFVEVAYRRAGGALRQRIWDPIAPLLGHAKQVFVVPDGTLSLMSLASLPVGKSRYLVESRPLIHFLSTERDLVPVETEGRAGEGLLAVGGPAFDQAPPNEPQETSPRVPQRDRAAEGLESGPFRGMRSSCAGFQTLRFGALLGSLEEAQEITTLWRKAKHGDREPATRAPSPLRGLVAGPVLLTGADATESALKEQAPGHSVLHFATHGFFLGGQCPSALEHRAQRQGIGLSRESPASVTGENPLLLSGLAVTGANQRDKAVPGEDDGILTAEEIAALDLSGVQWAVLSACETGAGEVRAGEGVLGLRRAFQVAGVRTLIMSLWAVDDEATRNWMRALYEARFLKGKSTAEAVREASVTMLRQLRRRGASTHPSSWGAFIAAGNWR